MASSEIESITFQPVAECLNQLHYSSSDLILECILKVKGMSVLECVNLTRGRDQRTALMNIRFPKEKEKCRNFQSDY
jgi:hypothetical protein